MLLKQTGAPLKHRVLVSLNVALDDTRWTAAGREHLIERGDLDRHVVAPVGTPLRRGGFETGFRGESAADARDVKRKVTGRMGNPLMSQVHIRPALGSEDLDEVAVERRLGFEGDHAPGGAGGLPQPPEVTALVRTDVHHGVAWLDLGPQGRDFKAFVPTPRLPGAVTVTKLAQQSHLGRR